MKRVMVFVLALVTAAALISDSTANARERGGRRSRKGGDEQTYTTYSQPTRIVYQMVPYERTYLIPYPLSNMQYTTNPGNAMNAGYQVPASNPTNPGNLRNMPTIATTPTTTMPAAPTPPELTPEMIALIQALRAAEYVK